MNNRATAFGLAILKTNRDIGSVKIHTKTGQIDVCGKSEKIKFKVKLK